MISRRTYVSSALALAVLLFFGLNIFVDNFFTDAKLDLTQTGQYTLAAGTRAIIAKLPEPVTLRFFFPKKNSANFPATAAYAKRVRDLLGEYASLSNGKIILEDVDPEPFTPEEDEAGASGIRPLQTEGGDSIYFGLEGSNSLDDKEAIPYFAVEREPYLEYDLTSMLYQLSHPEKPKLAVLTSLPFASAPNTGQPMGVYAQLQRDYAVTMLNPDATSIPAGTNLMLIAHPENVSVSLLRQIEIWALHGGKIVLFIDPMSELARQMNSPDAPPSSDFVPLLKGWGVQYSPQDVVLDRQLAQRIRADANSPNGVMYPLWLHLSQDNFSQRDPVTASLQSLNLASVGALTQVKGATTKFEPLLTSSTQASLLSRDIVMAVTDPSALMQMVEPSGKPFTIAGRITGKADFPGVGSGNINVIVMADTDIFDDRFWLRSDGPVTQPFADNEGFVLNAVENLSGSDDLISLRMRGNTEHPFTVVRALQAAADLKFRETLASLQARLTASEQEIAQLQQGGGGNATALSPQQTAEIERVRREIAGTRGQLRDVQHNLRADIDRLGTVLAFINILLMPLLVACFAIVFGLIRRRRARGAPENAGSQGAAEMTSARGA
ncbi:MAG TPA: Gldg family protein [Rhizomicrobium sp.]|jgi:ABC-type uncharacterized transport system involved in gliding motility auxiliary subunit|nr:Gldg family protein [Rhizomicrobium sp.]